MWPFLCGSKVLLWMKTWILNWVCVCVCVWKRPFIRLHKCSIFKFFIVKPYCFECSSAHALCGSFKMLVDSLYKYACMQCVNSLAWKLRRISFYTICIFEIRNFKTETDLNMCVQYSMHSSEYILELLRF